MWDLGHDPLPCFRGDSLKQPMALSNIERRSSSLMCEIYQWPHLGQPPTWCLLDTTASWKHMYNQLSLVQLSSHVQFFVTPWSAAYQAFLSLTISQSLPKFMSIVSVMPSSHLFSDTLLSFNTYTILNAYFSYMLNTYF